MRFLSGLAKLVLGVMLAIALMALGGVAATRYFMARLTLLPVRPVFENDVPPPDTVEAAPAPADAQTPAAGTSTPSPPAAQDPAQDPAQANPQANPQAAETISPDPEEEALSLTESEIEAGAYVAEVVQPIGLILRAGPGRDYPQVGGVEYNEEIVVVAESPDQRWLQVRIPSLGIEGWIISGNTEAVN